MATIKKIRKKQTPATFSHYFKINKYKKSIYIIPKSITKLLNIPKTCDSVGNPLFRTTPRFLSISFDQSWKSAFI